MFWSVFLWPFLVSGGERVVNDGAGSGDHDNADEHRKPAQDYTCTQAMSQFEQAVTDLETKCEMARQTCAVAHAALNRLAARVVETIAMSGVSLFMWCLLAVIMFVLVYLRRGKHRHYEGCSCPFCNPDEERGQSGEANMDENPNEQDQAYARQIRFGRTSAFTRLNRSQTGEQAAPKLRKEKKCDEKAGASNATAPPAYMSVSTPDLRLAGEEDRSASEVTSSGAKQDHVKKRQSLLGWSVFKE